MGIWTDLRVKIEVKIYKNGFPINIMPDNLTLEQRKKCMSNIRSKWTEQEMKTHSYLKANKIKHKMHPKILGSPDILLKETNTVVFLHGCFWHKCPKCFKEPKSNKEYWLPKIRRNIERDQKNVKLLKLADFGVLELWEHQIKTDFDDVLRILIQNGIQMEKI